ncbi:prohibitin family protein [Candidatus Parabeggiatoa sp. HSG14]|uniref:prohibitin family protein n=1 Tax=Candidatus Parabeggiatoa sp. HSG14 TaxID=3055593 RepID=UPI0025A8672C|nr:prohibitin family protein [Thiotrichales bacterium HSG14]
MKKKILEGFDHFSYWVKQKLPFLIVIALILMLVIVFFWSRIFVTLQSGEAGVKYWRIFGTETDYVYSEGLHFVFPWDTMYIYNVRIQNVMHDFEVLTNRGLPIKLKLAIRFSPEYDTVAVLHQQVGPNYVNTILIPQIESVLRKSIGHLQPEDIYVNKEGIITKIILQALEEAGQKFLKVNDVIIRAVELPPSIQKAIEKKLVEEQQHQAYVFRILKEEEEAKRKEIEATGIQNYQRIVTETLDEKLIKWNGIQATLEIAKSENAKVIIIGAGEEGLPVILGGSR